LQAFGPADDNLDVYVANGKFTVELLTANSFTPETVLQGIPLCVAFVAPLCLGGEEPSL